MTSAATRKLCNLQPHLSLETVFPALKLTQNCCLNYKHFFLKSVNLIINWLPISYAHVLLKDFPYHVTKYEGMGTAKISFFKLFSVFKNLEVRTGLLKEIQFFISFMHWDKPGSTHSSVGSCPVGSVLSHGEKVPL